MALRIALIVGAIVLARPSSVSADQPWNIDFYQGPIVNSQRAVGLGGAFVGVADGLEGHLSNPAAFAVRQPFFGNDWFDFDFGTTAYTVLGDVDYDLSGRSDLLTSASTQQGGFNLKFGRFGIGVHFIAQQFGIDVDVNAATSVSTGEKPAFAYSQSLGGLGLAYAFADGELVVGTLLSVGNARITALHTGDQVDLESEGFPVSLGMLFSPRGRPYRIGMSLRTGLSMTQLASEQDVAVETVGGLKVPDAVMMGATFDLGMSWMFGQRAYNIRPSYGDEPIPKGGKALKDIRRQYVLVSGAISITGPIQHGVGVAAYLSGNRQVSGASSVVSVRAGAESEVIDNLLVVRGGS